MARGIGGGKLRGSEILLAECGRGGLVSLDCSVAVVLVTGVCQHHCYQAGQGGDGAQEMHDRRNVDWVDKGLVVVIRKRDDTQENEEGALGDSVFYILLQVHIQMSPRSQ